MVMDAQGFYGATTNAPAIYPKGFKAKADGIAQAVGNVEEMVFESSWTVASANAATWNQQTFALTKGIYDIHIHANYLGAASVVGFTFGFSTDATANTFTDITYGTAGLTNALTCYASSVAVYWSGELIIPNYVVAANANFYVKFTPLGAGNSSYVGSIRAERRN